MTFLSIDSTRFGCFFSTALVQVFSDSLLYTAILPMLAKPRHDDVGKKKPDDDVQWNEQIRNFFRHCPYFLRQDKAMPVPL
jgi:hypothetical protein